MEWVHMDTTAKMKATSATARKLARQLQDIVHATREDAPTSAACLAMQDKAGSVASNLDAVMLLSTSPHLAAMVASLHKPKE